MMNNSEKKDLTDHKESGNVDMIWQRLKEKATEIKYGSFTCEMHVHDGTIKQVDVTEIKAKFRIE